MFRSFILICREALQKLEREIRVLIPLFRSFILMDYRQRELFHYCHYGLNPFVQVFYSNEVFENLDVGKIPYSLNPFVQVFYSNKRIWQCRRVKEVLVLIPLFRSFILMGIHSPL